MSSRRSKRIRKYVALGIGAAAGLTGAVIGGPVASGIAGGVGTAIGVAIAPNTKTRLQAAAIGGAGTLVGVAGSAILGRLSGAGPNSSVINSVGRLMTQKGPGLDSNGNPTLSDGRRVDTLGRAETIPGSGTVVDTRTGLPVSGTFRQSSAGVTASSAGGDGALASLAEGALKTLGPAVLGALVGGGGGEEPIAESPRQLLALDPMAGFVGPNGAEADPMQNVSAMPTEMPLDESSTYGAPAQQSWTEFLTTPAGLLTAAGALFAFMKFAG